MLSIIGFVLTISILVFIHEYGHYITAKICKVKVEEFSIGFGKELWARVDRAGVRWKICLIPLGGFVKMYKDTASVTRVDTTSIDSNDKTQMEKGAFYAKPAWQRFCIIFAGPFTNFLFAFLILTGFYFCYGKLTTPTVISQVISGSPAEQAGLMQGDKIIQVAGNEVEDFNDVRQNIILNPNLPLNLKVVRDNRILDISVTSYAGDRKETPMIGVQGVHGQHVNINILKSSYQAAEDIFNISLLTFKIIKQMILGDRSSDQMHGPITIAKESARSLNTGPMAFILFLAMLSINLGFVNLLPIPLLDGGHLFFTAYEIIARKPLPTFMQNIFNKIGLAIIIFLIIISVFNDLRMLF